MNRKKLIILVVALVAVIAAGSVYYLRHSRNGCISYYDKAGKLLYKDCSQ